MWKRKTFTPDMAIPDRDVLQAAECVICHFGGREVCIFGILSKLSRKEVTIKKNKIGRTMQSDGAASHKLPLGVNTK